MQKASAPPLIRHIGIYGLASLVSVLVFVPNVNGYFVADDWPVIARNIDAWQRGGQLFTTIRFGWYRPLFDLFIASGWKLFGLHPAGYHAFVLLLYAVVAAAVGGLAEMLTHDLHAGVLSTALFGLQGSHAEPVLWIAAGNEVLAGLFVVLSVAAYVLFRRSGKLGGLVCAWLGYLLGLASKETVVFLPIMLMIYDVWLYRPGRRRAMWQTLVPSLPFLLVGIAFAAFRIQTGSPYSTSVGILRILSNLAYYVSVEVLAMPDNYGYYTSLSLWRQEPWIPLLTISLAGAFIGILVWLLSKMRKGNLGHGRPESGPGPVWPSRMLGFAVAWSLVSLAPVALTATGRTAFLSSIGVSWTFALLFVSIRHVPLPARFARWSLVALVLWAGANLGVSAYRADCWRSAASTSKRVMSQLETHLSGEQSNHTVWLVGLPDHLKHAYTFRNAFPDAAKLRFPGWDIQAVLDVDLQGSTSQQMVAQGMGPMSCTDCSIFWYEDGVLERLR
jgi:cbb3-type cytochrome oxidase subunit 3